MAKLSGIWEKNMQAGLRATVIVESSFVWKVSVLNERLVIALGLKRGYDEYLKIEDKSSYGIGRYYISWRFALGYTDVPRENEERLQRQVDAVLAVFDGMEEKVKVIDENPLSWLQEPEVCLHDEQEVKDLLEACRSNPSSIPLEILKGDLARRQARLDGQSGVDCV